MPLTIKTAEEVGDSDVEARAAIRRTARETPLLRTVLRLFADSGGPVSVTTVVGAVQGAQSDTVRNTLLRLNDDDLLILHQDRIDLAYPFSAFPTRFIVRREDGRERFTCCALDALGIAPMLNEGVEVASFCHHCDSPLRFTVGPEGPSSGADDLMVWVTKSEEGETRACTGL